MPPAGSSNKLHISRFWDSPCSQFLIQKRREEKGVISETWNMEPWKREVNLCPGSCCRRTETRQGSSFQSSGHIRMVIEEEEGEDTLPFASDLGIVICSCGVYWEPGFGR